MKKTQAGLELLAIIAMLLVFTLGINNIFFKMNLNAFSVSEREAMVSKCLDLNTLFSKVLSEQNLSANIRLEYNLTINSTAKLIILYSKNDSYSCGLISSRITNNLSQKEFNVLAKNTTIMNNGAGVLII